MNPAAEPPSPPVEPSEPKAEAPAKPETPADPLLALAQAAKAARLSPADEEQAVTLLKERLTGGRAGITSALPALTEGLPWVVAVNAVSAVWEQLSAVMRRHLLGGIAKIETDPARRLRLSLARGIFKIDPAAGLKLAAAASAGLKDPETGALSGKHRQYFFNVFIGKGKPWLLQLPLADLKGADADALAHAAIESFSFCPPFSQLSILRWIHGAGRIKKISAGDLAVAAKGISRWNAKLQRQLKTELGDLPPELEAALKPEALKPAPVPAEKPAKEPAAKPAKPEKSASKAPEHPAKPAKEAQAEASAEPAAPEQAGEPAERAEAQVEELIIPRRAERERAAREQAKEPRLPEKAKNRQPEELRRPERNRPFDAKEALRGIEGYISNLRSELETAKAQLNRQEKQRPRAQRAEEALPSEEVEALKRHNARLESTVAELRAELEDLAGNHEAIAESRQLYSAAPLPEENVEALRALLAIKLQEAFETYHAMRLEPLDKVFRLDYRDLLGSVFDVLLTQGVPLKKETSKP